MIRAKLSRARVPLVSGATMIYNQVSTALFGVYLAALLGAEAYGTVNLARTLFIVALVLTPLGLDIAFQRHLGRGRSEPEILAAEIFWPRLVAIATSALIAILLVFGGAQVLEARVFAHDGFGPVLAATMIALPFATDMTILGGAYRGLYRPIPSLLASYLVQPTARIVLVFALLSLVGGVRAAVYGTAASYVVAWLFIAAMSRRAFPLSLSALRRALPAAGAILRVAPLLGLTTFVFALSRSLDTIALGYFATASDVGRYAVVVMVGQMVAMIGASLGQTLGTSIAAAAEAGDKPRMADLLRHNMRLGSILCAPFGVAVAVWGRDVDLLLGPSYRIPMAVFAVTATTQWLLTVTNNASWVLVTTGRQLLEFRNNILALVVQAVACLLFVPLWGAVGAACATFLSLAAITMSRQIQIAKVLDGTVLEPRLVYPLAISAAMTLPFLMVEATMTFRAWWLTALLVAAHVGMSFMAIQLLMPDERALDLRALLRRWRPTR